ncbi:imidazoleglycerol-phosphate dehydratase [Bacillus solimangrovi]|uniref:Imidazoleglycerol-phosphate dehydratase n=1 Tax=Bacillus solimangrovi TaxID=1305675 RepID=A0A1E5LFZ2_9BACI|nr:imidazoleglycerol-phosphate dehydratase [Bacillus solimangrovi]OEH92990.1 imidazoleglycerol-phosphate dehydratase [Bacillus solimangrovi]
MTNRNSKSKSQNQGAPETGELQYQNSGTVTSGDNNKGTKYRSNKGSKSKQ